MVRLEHPKRVRSAPSFTPPRKAGPSRGTGWNLPPIAGTVGHSGTFGLGTEAYAEIVDPLPVIAVRLLDGRVGSTLLLQLLATSDEVVLERRYPEGELRYLSYCIRMAEWAATPWEPTIHPGVTELMFGPAERGAPIPFAPTLVRPGRLGPLMLTGMWEAMSAELRRSAPGARFYAEKLVGNGRLLADSDIPLRIIDVVRDPRDIFCSMRSFTAGGRGFGRSDGQSDDDFLSQISAAQLERLQSMRTTASQVDRVLVRYEDLVGDFVGQADRLASWLGLHFDTADVLGDYERRRHHMTTRSVDESVGRWRRELSADKAHKIWDVLGGELEPLGYVNETAQSSDA
jgi:hypothetical protein